MGRFDTSLRNGPSPNKTAAFSSSEESASSSSTLCNAMCKFFVAFEDAKSFDLPRLSVSGRIFGAPTSIASERVPNQARHRMLPTPLAPFFVAGFGFTSCSVASMFFTADKFAVKGTAARELVSKMANGIEASPCANVAEFCVEGQPRPSFSSPRTFSRLF